MPCGPANEGAVHILQQALVRAQRGEIQSVFLAYADGEGTPSGCWDGRTSHLLLAAMRLVRRIHRYLDGRSDQ